MKYSESQFEVEVISQEVASTFEHSIAQFDCGSKEINTYFREKAIHDNSNTLYALIDGKSEIAGLASIACSGVNIDSANLEAMIPSVIINYFAIDEKYHHCEMEGYDDEVFNLSDWFLCYMISLIRDITRQIAAVDIVLYSVPQAKSFYERNCFLPFEDFMKASNKNYLDGCVAMHMPL